MKFLAFVLVFLPLLRVECKQRQCNPRSIQLSIHYPLVSQLYECDLVTFPGRTLKLNDTTLEKLAQDAGVMVLFHASWCPFSKEMLSKFVRLSALHSYIHHVSIEESAVGPSFRAKYGVSSVPALIYMSGTSRTRYHGHKNIPEVLEFYENIVGEAETGPERSTPDNHHIGSQDVFCPFPKVITLENWLPKDVYLALATAFVVLRVAFYFVPKAAAFLRRHYFKFMASRRETLSLRALINDCSRTRPMLRRVNSDPFSGSFSSTGGRDAVQGCYTV